MSYSWRTEADFQEDVIRNIPAHFTHMESFSKPGFPDLDYAVVFTKIDGVTYGHTGHIELKYSSVARPAFLRPSQKNWFRRNIHHGGKPMVWTATNTHVYVHAVPDIDDRILRGKPTHLAWIDSASDSIPVTHDRLWQVLTNWMHRPRSDGRSMWNPERQGD